MKKMIPLALAAAMAVSACTTTQRVSVRQPGDQAMNCQQIRAEFARLDGVSQDAQNDGGVNTANVAAVLFFWPAAVGNYMNARDAQQLVQQRRDHLMTIYNSKACDGPSAGMVGR